MIDLIAIENHLPALQFVIPLLLAPVAILVSLPFLSWLVALFGSLFCLYASVSLFFQVSEFGKINYFMGGWLPPYGCLLYTSPSPRDLSTSRMPSSA